MTEQFGHGLPVNDGRDQDVDGVARGIGAEDAANRKALRDAQASLEAEEIRLGQLIAASGDFKSNGTVPMSSDLAMGNHKITGCADGVSSSDVATVGQLGSGGGGIANPLTGDLAAGSHKITGLADGASPQDAATVAQLGGDVQSDGSNNILVGPGLALPSAGCTDNIGSGAGVLAALTTGDANIAIGTGAMAAATSAGYSVAVGWQALNKTNAGPVNTAVGAGALANNLTGGTNVAVGANALTNADTTGNAALGKDAGTVITSGPYNTLVGYQANTSAGSSASAVAVGRGAVAGTGEICIGALASSKPCLVCAAGAPVDASHPDGSFYFRQDGGAMTTIYQARSGVWVGIV